MTVHRAVVRLGTGVLSLISLGLCAPAQAQDDTFVFMSAQLACPPGGGTSGTCYLSSPGAATKAVAALRDAGIRTF